MSNPADQVLEIDFHDPTLTLRLSASGKPQSHKATVSASQLERAARDLLQVLARGWQHGGGVVEDARDLRRQGVQLACVALPVALQESLATCEGLLRLVVPESLAGVPWELAVVGESTIGERLAVGRVATAEESPQPPSAADPPQIGIVANPEFNLPAAAREGDLLRRMLGRQEGITRPRIWANRVTRGQLVEALGGVDWLHFAGHARTEPADEAGWQMADGPFGPQQVADSSLSGVPRFVFAHACASAGGAENAEQVDAIQNMAAALRQRGVNHFLGTLAPVLDEECCQLAEWFYKLVLEGQPVGEAVRQVRARAAEELGPDSLLPHCYVLYGDPRAVLVRGEAAAEVAAAASKQSATGPATKLIVESYPTNCNRCGKQISTRHGVGCPDPAEVSKVWCRACAREATPAADPGRPARPQRSWLAEADAAQGAGGASAPAAPPPFPGAAPSPPPVAKAAAATPQPAPPAAPPASASTAETIDPHNPTISAADARAMEQHFMGRFEAAAKRFQAVIEPRQGKKVEARLALSKSGAAAPPPKPVRFRKAAAPTVQGPVGEWRRYELRGYQPFGESKQKPEIAVEFLPPPRLGESPLCDGRPIDRNVVAQRATAWSQLASQKGVVAVLVSPTGWTEETQEYARGEGADAFYHPQMCLVLVDAQDYSLTHRAEDLRLRGLLPLFDFEDESEKVARVLKNLEDRLPLATSLAATTVAGELGASPAVVDTAFRMIAQRPNLRLDEIPEFGLVLSQQVS